MGLSRRDFLKIAAVAGAAGVSDGLTGIVEAEGSDLLTKDVKSIPTFCDICFWQCGVVAKVADGKVIKLEGNPLDPASRGMLCARGNAGIGLLYDPDRLKYPMLNAGKRGEPQWKKVSWDEAYGFIADRMKRIKNKYGAESIACMYHGLGGVFWRHLLTSSGSPNSALASWAQCRGPVAVGYDLTFGDGSLPSPEPMDLAESRFIVLIGSHMGENVHNSQIQDFTTALSKGAKLCVVDPRFSNAAAKANWWLPIRPGTDLALLLAWINVLLKEELHDKDYIKKYATGLADLKDAVKGCTPEWASKETDIPVRLILETVREMASYSPRVLIHPGRHAVWYGDDTQRLRAMAILTTLLGAYGRKGGYYIPTEAGLPGYPYQVPPPRPEKPKLIGYPYGADATTTEIRKATLTGKPYPVKGWIVHSMNILKTMPAPEETIEAIRKLDLMVVCDVLPYEIVDWADVVLPECTYLERYDDLKIIKGKAMAIALRQPVVQPMYETKPAWQMVRELGIKLGLKEYFPWKNIEEYLSKRLETKNIALSELKRKGTIVFPETAAPYIVADNEPVFNTDSGKIELYSSSLKDNGFDPVPKYKRHKSPPEGYFRLLYGRHPLHSFGRTINNPLLNELFNENTLWINATKAAALGLKNGRYVVLVNQDGVMSNRIKLKATERIREDCVYMVHGFGHNSTGTKKAYKKGADDAALMTRYAVDPIMGGTGMRVNFVKIKAV
jgi:thiosulfate reductase/polysulfide reductase chain A